jgi:prepilin-type N-terminal cleavage/methylation domain-containing protein
MKNRLQVTGVRFQKKIRFFLHFPGTWSLTPDTSLRASRGFTLVEMIVSVALFSIVMVVAVGALLSLTGANKKAQAIQSVMNNLNITLDGMVRNIRMGSDFRCGMGAYQGGGQGNCGDGDTIFTFTCNPDTATCGDNERWTYMFDADDNTICKAINSGSCEQIVAPEVTIEDMKFYVVGTAKGNDPTSDREQPKVVIVIKGTAGGQNVKTRSPFHIQATAVQRELDI